jgi:hypothetical protein
MRVWCVFIYFSVIFALFHVKLFCFFISGDAIHVPPTGYAPFGLIQSIDKDPAVGSVSVNIYFNRQAVEGAPGDNLVRAHVYS